MNLTMTKLFRKLQKQGIRHYIQFLFCVTFAIVLITSFSLMLYTSVVQQTLPIGGDSRKQVMLIFAIALIGCFVFTLYAASLFLKYKSRETGVFLVLGAKKKRLTTALLIELSSLMAGCFALGIALGIGLGFMIWKLFALTLFRQTADLSFNLSLSGLFLGFSFGFIVYLALMIQAVFFMKKTNLMDILYDQRRNEPLHVATKSYGLSGVVLLIIGVVLGYGGPQALAFFGKLMPSVWNVVYVLSLMGLYRMMVYLVGHHKRGKNPQKYYRNMLNGSMMKFQGKQTVRNMIICTLLLSASLFAVFYTAQLWSSIDTFSGSPVDYALHYPESESVLTRQDIEQLAKKHHVEISDYEEVSLAELVVSGVWRDWDDDGSLIEDYHERYQLADLLPVALFNQVTGENHQVVKGQYYRVIAPEKKESFFEKFSDMDQITNPVTAEALPVTFAGTVDYQPFVNNGNFRIVLNDEDYEWISQGLPSDYYNRQILFNSEETADSFTFSRDIYREVLSRASKTMAVQKSYDSVMKEWTLAAGREYDYDFTLELAETNNELMEEWKYYPVMKSYAEQTFFENFAVFFLVFIYVALICLAAVAVISYTRCTAIGTGNKMVFDDLRKLGAYCQFINQTIVKQLRKIFVVPALLSLLLVGIFTFSMLVGNDGQLTSSEAQVLLADTIIVVIVFCFHYGIYRLSLKKVQRLIGIT